MILKIEIDDAGEWTITKNGETFKLQNVNWAVKHGIEQDIAAMADERDGYIHQKPDGTHFISIAGEWIDGEGPLPA